MKAKLLLALVIFLSGAGFGGYEYYEFITTEVPQFELEQEAIKKKIMAKQADYNRLKGFAQNIEIVKQELRDLNLQLESALEHLPKTFNLAALLRKLTAIAQNSGVELASFRPEKNETRGEGQFFSSIKIDFDIKGTYAQSLLFFDQLTRLKRIVNLETLKMTSREVSSNSASNANKGTAAVAELTGSIRTYRFTE